MPDALQSLEAAWKLQDSTALYKARLCEAITVEIACVRCVVPPASNRPCASRLC